MSAIRAVPGPGGRGLLILNVVVTVAIRAGGLKAIEVGLGLLQRPAGHFQSARVQTQGAKVGQLSFMHGCNDWGGLMMEENVVSQAGTVHHVQIEEMRQLSAELGLELKKRNVFYEIVEEAVGA